MPRARSLSSPIAAFAPAARALDEHPGLLGVVVELGLGAAQVQRDRQQALLGAVVEVAFDAAAFGLGGVDASGPAGPQILVAGQQEAAVVGAQERSGHPGVGQCDSP